VPEYECGKCNRGFTSIFAVSSHYGKCNLRVATTGNDEEADDRVEVSEDTVRTSEANGLETVTDNASTSEPVSMVSCGFCERVFKTKSGRGQHVKKTHPETLDGKAKSRSHVPWNDEEIYLLAKVEHGFKNPVTNASLQSRYAELFASDRTVEAIKKLRQGERYRKALESFVQGPSGPGDEVLVETASAEGNQRVLRSLRNRKEPEVDVTDEPASSTLSVSESDKQCLEDLAAQLETEHEVLRLILLKARENISQELIDQAFDYVSDFTSKTRRASVKTRRPKQGKRHNQGNGQKKPSKRLVRYAKAQDLWLKNRKALFGMIMEGTLEAEDTCQLDPQQTLSYWEGIFGHPSSSDDEKPNRLEQCTDMFSPPTAEEIRSCIRKQRKKAKGPDGLTAEDLELIPMTLLQAVYALICATGLCPAHFRHARTVLIPKCSPPSADPAQYRPITIGSILMRIFHGVLANRWKHSVRFHAAQKGFMPCDGILENIDVLQYLMERSRKAHEPIYLASIDVSKAFDSVSWHSLFRALRNFGFDKSLICYLESYYHETTTEICLRHVAPSKIAVRRGVKQGDPISPYLFNMMLDEVFRQLPAVLGVRIGDQNVNSLAFADDIVLISRTFEGLQDLMTTTTDFLRKRGMSINPDKSVFLGIELDGKRKRMYQVREASVTVDGKKLKVLDPRNVFKYLGVTFSASGKEAARFEVLDKGLQAIRSEKALRPEQKIRLIVDYLVPKIRHEFTLGRLTLGLLRRADSAIRSHAKQILNLPHYCPDGFLYTPVRSGGLGLPLLAISVLLSLRKRLIGIQKSTNPITGAYCLTEEYQKRLDWCNKGLVLRSQNGNIAVENGPELNRLLHTMSSSLNDGKGFPSFNKIPFLNNWVKGEDWLVKGRLYQQSLRLRWNLLIVGSTANRGKQVKPRCRYGCPHVETLDHVLQSCYANKSARIRRHDNVVHRLADEMNKLGMLTLTEPVFASEVGRRIPDLIVKDSPRTAVVLDVACPFERSATTLNDLYLQKQRKYAGAKLDEAVKKQLGVEEVRYGGLIFGSRGSLCQRSLDILKKLRIPKFVIYSICRKAMVDSIKIWRHFLRTNTFRTESIRF
jgi:Reverse transcriptase (RNA-dependent DNA polymerase)